MTSMACIPPLNLEGRCGRPERGWHFWQRFAGAQVSSAGCSAWCSSRLKVLEAVNCGALRFGAGASLARPSAGEALLSRGDGPEPWGERHAARWIFLRTRSEPAAARRCLTAERVGGRQARGSRIEDFGGPLTW